MCKETVEPVPVTSPAFYLGEYFGKNLPIIWYQCLSRAPADQPVNFVIITKLQNQSVPPRRSVRHSSLFLTFIAGRTGVGDHLEVVERCGAHPPPLLFVPATARTEEQPRSVVPGDSLPSPLLALQVERLPQTPRLEDTGEGAGLDLLLLLPWLGELDVRGGREAGAELPGGWRGEVAQANLPGAHGGAGQRHGVRAVPVPHYRHSEGRNVQTGSQLGRLLEEFGRPSSPPRPGVSAGFLLEGAEFARSCYGARGEVGRPGRGQTARLGEVAGGKETVSLGSLDWSGGRKVTVCHVFSCFV